MRQQIQEPKIKTKERLQENVNPGAWSWSGSIDLIHTTTLASHLLAHLDHPRWMSPWNAQHTSVPAAALTLTNTDLYLIVASTCVFLVVCPYLCHLEALLCVV